MSAFSEKKQLTSEVPNIILAWNRPLQTASDTSEYTSKYPGDNLNARIKSLEYLILETVCLFVTLMTERPDEAEAWIKDRDSIDNESDSGKIFIRELIACHRIYQEDPEIREFCEAYVLNNIDKLKTFAEDWQRLRENTTPISEESLTSLEEEETLSRLWQVVKSNNTCLIQWSCCMLLWCRQAIPELIFDPIYEAESACKDMYATIHEVPRITAKLLYIITNIDIYKCTDTYETVFDTNIIEKLYQTYDFVSLNKLLELNSLRICSCKIANLHTSLYAEIRNIKYTMEEILK